MATFAQMELLARLFNAMTTDGSGNVCMRMLSPQSLLTTASPTFASLTLSAALNLTGVVISSANTLTLGTNAQYVASGTTTTWTLPDLATTVGRVYFIKNRGSGALTLQRAGSDNLYDTSVVTSISIPAGEARIIGNDGTYWNVM